MKPLLNDRFKLFFLFYYVDHFPVVHSGLCAKWFTDQNRKVSVIKKAIIAIKTTKLGTYSSGVAGATIVSKLKEVLAKMFF